MNPLTTNINSSVQPDFKGMSAMEQYKARKAGILRDGAEVFTVKEITSNEKTVHLTLLSPEQHNKIFESMVKDHDSNKSVPHFDLSNLVIVHRTGEFAEKPEVIVSQKFHEIHGHKKLKIEHEDGKTETLKGRVRVRTKEEDEELHVALEGFLKSLEVTNKKNALQMETPPEMNEERFTPPHEMSKEPRKVFKEVAEETKRVAESLSKFSAAKRDAIEFDGITTEIHKKEKEEFEEARSEIDRTIDHNREEISRNKTLQEKAVENRDKIS